VAFDLPAGTETLGWVSAKSAPRSRGQIRHRQRIGEHTEPVDDA
jgi:hypothetical protein